jgi:hypothetical protein
MSSNDPMFAVVAKCGTILTMKRSIGSETADFLAVFRTEDEALMAAFFIDMHSPEHKPRVQPIATSFVPVERARAI